MARIYRFADFELSVDAYCLRRAGDRIRLERTPMDILIVLVERAGRLVDRHTIRMAIWGEDVFVDQDAAINTAVRKIREALGDDASRPAFVETVIGKGYRFIAPLGTGDDQQRQPTGCIVKRGRAEYVLNAGENVLGRDPHSQVRIAHPSVSRRHAVIRVDAGGITLEDLRSRNGTFVNGRRIDTPVALRDGAIVSLGPVTLTIRAAGDLASTLSGTGSRSGPPSASPPKS